MPATARFRFFLSAAGQAVAALLLACTPVLAPLLDSELRPPPGFWLRHAFVVALEVGVFYLNTQVLVPRLLFRDKARAYSLAVIGLLLGTMLLGSAVGHRPPGGRLPLTMQASGAVPLGPGGGGPPRSLSGFASMLFYLTGGILGLGTVMAFTRRARVEAGLRRELEQEKQAAELSFLKAQLNPHLFFNTLNNIYGLTEIDPDKARLALYRLSRLMRYVLYQTQESTVLLSQEIQFLQDYLGLMQLRLTPNMTVDFQAPEQPADRPLAPLLVLPLLENAFKHGVSTDEPATISIRVELVAGTLQVRVRNRIFAPHTTALAQDSGIGLANTRRRLELLYPGRYELRVGPDPARPGEFQAYLALPLAEPPVRAALYL